MPKSKKPRKKGNYGREQAARRKWEAGNFKSVEDARATFRIVDEARRRRRGGSVRISVSGEVIPGAAQRGCPLYLRCSMPDLMR